MRDFAIDVLRDSVRPSEEGEAGATRSEVNAGPLNSFALGIPVLLVGGVLLPLFPPLGLTLGGLGVLLCLAGLGAALARALWGRIAAAPRADPEGAGSEP